VKREKLTSEQEDDDGDAGAVVVRMRDEQLNHARYGADYLDLLKATCVQQRGAMPIILGVKSTVSVGFRMRKLGKLTARGTTYLVTSFHRFSLYGVVLLGLQPFLRFKPVPSSPGRTATGC